MLLLVLQCVPSFLNKVLRAWVFEGRAFLTQLFKKLVSSSHSHLLWWIIRALLPSWTSLLAIWLHIVVILLINWGWDLDGTGIFHHRVRSQCHNLPSYNWVDCFGVVTHITSSSNILFYLFKSKSRDRASISPCILCLYHLILKPEIFRNEWSFITSLIEFSSNGNVTFILLVPDSRGVQISFCKPSFWYHNVSLSDHCRRRFISDLNTPYLLNSLELTPIGKVPSARLIQIVLLENLLFSVRVSSRLQGLILYFW